MTSSVAELLRPTIKKTIVSIFLLAPILLVVGYSIYSMGRLVEEWKCHNQFNECLPSEFPLSNLSFGEFLTSPLYGIIVFALSAPASYIVACAFSRRALKSNR